MKKAFTLILLLSLLTVAFGGSAFALHPLTGGCGESLHCCDGCAPGDEGGEHDDCHDCTRCSCHAPALVAPFVFTVERSGNRLSSIETAAQLPQVFLSLFIPPQNA